MPAFQYAALDPRGRTRKGLLEGDTARHVRQQLRERGLTPVDVSEVRGGRADGRRGGRVAGTDHADRSARLRGQARDRISATDLALLTRQLAILVGAGLPLEQALAGVARHAERPRLQRLWLALRARVLEGHSLADALDDFPRAFPELYRATAAAGERAGRLDRVLERLADYTERRQQLRQKTALALIYPALLSVVAVLVIAGLLGYVVPQVVQVFTSMQQQLPWLTRALLAVSGFVGRYGAAMLLAAAGVALGFGYMLRVRSLRARLQRLWLRLPLFGRLARAADSARFARTCGILLESGVPLLDSLNISARVVTLEPLREAIAAAAAGVKEGGALAPALADGGQFPALTVQLVASGEASGRLADMLHQAAAQQERESETLGAALLGLFEPLLILVMGAVVLVIVLAILLPIFDLNTMVR